MDSIDSYRVGLIQLSPSENIDKNMDDAVSAIEEAARGGAKLVCLPELYRSRYFCQSEDAAAFDLAETIPGPSTETLGAAARRCSVSVIAPLFERRAAGLYHNSAAVLGPDGAIVGLYRKMHIPDDPGYFEKFYFAPGDLGFAAHETPYGRIGVLICWDQWFPEAARLASLAGAEVLFFPTAIGWHPGEKASLGERQRDAWITIQRAHAIANGVYVAAVNRAGVEEQGKGAIEFWGSSFACDPFGAVLSRAGSAKPDVIYFDVDSREIEATRRGWPFLRDRRIDSYAGIQSRYGEQ